MTKDTKYMFRSGPNLAIYRAIGALQQYWEMRWKNARLKNILKRARKERIEDLEEPFGKYLLKDGPLLEAGCGTGRIVAALQARGYRVEGIDYAAETIARVKAIDPELDVRVGDIFAIDRPDGYYAGYISLGVLEHEFNGPMVGLAEAHRVLRPGGIALIMVPYLNRPRKKMYQIAKELDPKSAPTGIRFYQYQFDLADFARILIESGFLIVDQAPLMLFEGLSADYPLGRWLSQRNYFSWRIFRGWKKLSEHAPGWLKKRNSSMMMFITTRQD